MINKKRECLNLDVSKDTHVYPVLNWASVMDNLESVFLDLCFVVVFMGGVVVVELL